MRKTKKTSHSDFNKLLYYKLEFLKRNKQFLAEYGRFRQLSEEVSHAKSISVGQKAQAKLKKLGLQMSKKWGFIRNMWYVPQLSSVSEESFEKKVFYPLFHSRVYPPPKQIEYRAKEIIWDQIPEKRHLLKDELVLGVDEADCLDGDLSKMTVTLDLRAHKKDLMHEVGTAIDAVNKWRNAVGAKKEIRTRSDRYDCYLKAYDCREEGLTYLEIAKKVFPDEMKDLIAAKHKARRAYLEGKRLIEGGYKDI